MSLNYYKVLMYGDRNWENQKAVERELQRLVSKHGKTKLIIIEGGAPGADTMARVVATRESVHVAHCAALWDTRHRGAGPQRNKVMAAFEPDEAICFHPNIRKSKGSKSMMKILSDELDLSSKLVTK